MTISEACVKYETEQDPGKKESLEKSIIRFCQNNPDATIPDVAKKLYIKSLIG